VDLLHLAFQRSGSKPNAGLGAGSCARHFDLVFQGAVAAGSATWGAVAARAGLGTALLWAGIGTLLSTALGLFLRLPDQGIDLASWNHWRLPAVSEAISDVVGPVLVTDEYHVDVARVPEVHQDHARIRTRQAARWRIAMGNLPRPRDRRPLPRNFCEFLGGTRSPA
jgi:hypothetical protein